MLPSRMGLVGWCEGGMYLKSLGRSTDIGLQLGKACYPCSRLGSRGNVLFYFFTFMPVPLSSLSLSFISSTSSSISFLPFSGRRHKMTHKVDVSFNPNTINQLPSLACLCWKVMSPFLDLLHSWWEIKQNNSMHHNNFQLINTRSKTFDCFIHSKTYFISFDFKFSF